MRKQWEILFPVSLRAAFVKKNWNTFIIQGLINNGFWAIWFLKGLTLFKLKECFREKEIIDEVT